MRLLQTKTLEFGEFLDSQIPPYAILSHRWGEKEVSYKEMRKVQKNTFGGRSHAAAAQKMGQGMAKIKNFCLVACRDGWDWAWIDTCCIDKRSSAELSESINAMYKWYKRSGWCYIFLSDFRKSTPQDRATAGHDSQDWHTSFQKSEWFTRGWTLQELLAPHPSNISFLDINWTCIGNLGDLADEVAASTGISTKYLCGLNTWYRLQNASVAQKMCWASRRNTSREEDIAYCLLGLFNVHMPLLYGEGAAKAFYRLQVEIMAQSDDESLFAWSEKGPVSGLLATSPACFTDSGNIFKSFTSISRPPFSVTNKGLEFSVPQHHVQQIASGGVNGKIYLNCYRSLVGASSDIAGQQPVTLKFAGRGDVDRYTAVWRLSDVLGSSQDLNLGDLDAELRQGTTCTIYIVNPFIRST
ncbi:MAG: hypothetical protein Q9168_003425 [Polycauliona sp. 1 TL-2023]